MKFLEETTYEEKTNVNATMNVTVAQAKNELPRLIHSSETEGIIPISRHGKVVAYIVSERDFRKLTRSGNSFSEKLKSFREKFDLQETSPWENIRSKEMGRAVHL